MKKIVFQIVVIVSLFFSLWFVLSKIDWMGIFKVEQATQTTEKKLGDLLWDLYNKAEKEIKSEKANLPLDSILSKICNSNNIDKSQIKLHLINSDEINAFALPNKHLVINSGLILACENEAELCGVISHEIAHMELSHVMKKLIKEVGLSVVISMTAGNGGAEKIKETAKLLSSSAYDRNLEKEADIKAVDYMTNSNINPEHFANFLYRLGDSESTSMKYFSWISTHPDSKERAEYIIKYIGKKNEKSEAVLATETWNKLKEYLTEK